MQLSLFDDDDPGKIVVIVWQPTPDTWQAEIGGGWWVSVSNTQDAAVKSVIEKFQKDIER